MDTTLIGKPLSEVDTPALVLDLDVLERNIRQMAGEVAERGAQWRPHSKANKTPAIVHLEIAAGAIGVTCAKVGEAEVMAANGIRDILIANQVVGPIKTRRFAALAHQADVMCAVDSAANVLEHQAAAKDAGSKPRIVVEVDSGMDRAGVQPGKPAVELAKLIDAQPDLRFAGFMTWEGHCMGVDDPVEREAKIRESVALLLDTVEEAEAAGLTVSVVSAGGTGTYLTTAGIEGVTEVEAGGGIFGDVSYKRFNPDLEPAVGVLCQVTSRPDDRKVIIDAGRKAIDPTACQPHLREYAADGDIRFSAEHGTIRLAESSAKPAVGDRLFLESGYSDQLCHLHERFIGVRNGVVEAVWPILGRGRLQ